MPLATEADLYYAALRLGPPPLGAAEPGPVALTGPGEVSRQSPRAALDQCGRWLNEQFGPHLEVLIGVQRAKGMEPGLYVPGQAAPLPGPAARLEGLEGLRAAGIPVALLWFGDAAAAGADLGALLVRVGWGAETARAALDAAGYRAAFDPRAGLVRRPGSGVGHLGSLVVAESAGSGS
ncbi:hypothetical protein OG455_22225 [Kitasatospora sp. NBC_01287]|uniref:hypothetical protein n=1 Tax=Kitasatospora sp. NBC_01287 TaxID=2903573 RepID=UPI00225B1492|nr:hypothetical protein [Kitasatospora sp. NBC_01287]MCX4748196.1 hypothetical protein [Kitasatospora sp. NBC_01287]